MIMAAIKDAAIMKIPNWISLLTIALFFIMMPFAWTGFPAFGEHLLVGLVVFAAGFAMFALGWLGGGDAKLMAATSLWWVWSDLIMYIFYTGVIGGVLALLMLVGRKYAPVWLSTSSWGYGLFKEEKKMPYGLALAGGALLTLPQSAIFKAALGL
jgi:prepilin peptidase CpaA